MNRGLAVTKQRKAFLDMIAFSEGTSTIKGSDNGYNVLVGGELFDNKYIEHPNILVVLNPKAVKPLKSTAAGRYQILHRYWTSYKLTLGLKDFSPANQDQVALTMIKEQEALLNIDRHQIITAINKCANIWASFPGAGYGQHEQKRDKLLEAFRQAGGVIK